jgi:GTP:adenosylcobinamide-phosphate guanylyltransferase
MMITVLLMAAGAGTRMLSDVPKPFIKVGQTQMWELVAKKLGLHKKREVAKYLIVQDQHKQYLLMDSESEKYVDTAIAITDMTSKGPAWSVAAATMSMSSDQSILILDSDCWVEVPPNAPAYMQHNAALLGSTEIEQILRMRPAWGTDIMLFGVRVFEDTPNASEIVLNVKSDPLGRVEAIREGGVKNGGILNVGAYWFRSVGDFRARLAKCTSQTEVKISDVVNVRAWPSDVMVLNGEFRNLGTRELLDAYLKDSDDKTTDTV